MTYELDHGMARRLGLVVLSTDETLEVEARQTLQGRDVGLYHTRIYSAPSVTPQSLMDMQARVAASVSLLPDTVEAIGYGCTSASVLIGPDAVTEQVHAVRPGLPVTNPISGVLAGLQALSAKRIIMITPYTSQVASPMRQFLEARGIAVVHETSFGEEIDPNVARISEASTKTAILEALQTHKADAVFASCTNLRTYGIIDALEAETGVPVISSNQALLWHLLMISGIDAAGWGPGQLFKEKLT
ncbi:maleate cis-trans isomerase family protein [Roseovarius rhodophyticola]|uniref:Aspartate/glutamate racemase family protein n=1 Tax=Roseovarius rhodophyticola TaxID=3080827 RepID=A0ABZ2TEQ3_9RHOB|nr:aspartate/glutamate racemase family protein [Roseovarius sp. W115]MDV2928375.1 aspartate/glutamate racemase family protein [Roseovarius sp. W115]